MTYRVSDIMERYGVSQATVLHWLNTGQLKCLNVGRDPGKRRARYRITEEQLAEFELMRTAGSEPVAPRRRRKRKDEVVKVYGGW